MVDSGAVSRDWKQYGAVKNAHSAKGRATLDHQTTPHRRHPRRPRQEHASQSVRAAKSDSEVHPDSDEIRKLDWRFHCDQQAILPVLSPQPRIDLIAAWEAPAGRYLLPLA